MLPKEPANVASGVGHAAQAKVQGKAWLACHVEPGCADVAGPWRGAVALAACGARPAQHEGSVPVALVKARELPLLRERDEVAHLHAGIRALAGPGVVDHPEVCIHALGLIEVEPPRVNALVTQPSVLVGPPGSGRIIEEVHGAAR